MVIGISETFQNKKNSLVWFGVLFKTTTFQNASDYQKSGTEEGRNDTNMAIPRTYTPIQSQCWTTDPTSGVTGAQEGNNDTPKPELHMCT
jgi:hypothetical protein